MGIQELRERRHEMFRGRAYKRKKRSPQAAIEITGMYGNEKSEYQGEGRRKKRVRNVENCWLGCEA